MQHQFGYIIHTDGSPGNRKTGISLNNLAHCSRIREFAVTVLSKAELFQKTQLKSNKYTKANPSQHGSVWHLLIMPSVRNASVHSQFVTFHLIELIPCVGILARSHHGSTNIGVLIKVLPPNFSYSRKMGKYPVQYS